MGRLAGIPTRSLLLPVIASTIVAAFAWSYSYNAMLRLAGDLDPALPALMTATIVAALLSWLLLDEWLHARRMARTLR
jgi:drug/metabolite transporter (DMT)-like permease